MKPIKTYNSCQELYDGWNKMNNIFKDFSKDDITALRKAIELNRVSNNWELIFWHMPRLELLSREYSTDSKINLIYNHMQRKVNTFIVECYKDNSKYSDFEVEQLFHHQPKAHEDFDIFKEKLYDVENCSYAWKLKNKYPELKDILSQMIDFG